MVLKNKQKKTGMEGQYVICRLTVDMGTGD